MRQVDYRCDQDLDLGELELGRSKASSGICKTHIGSLIVEQNISLGVWLL